MIHEDIKITDVKLSSNAPYFSNRSVSGRFQKRYIGVQFYELELTLNYMEKDTSKVKRFFALHQQSQPFDFDLSYYSRYEGSVQGLVQTAQQAPSGSRLIKLGVFSGVLEAGTLIQFQNHSKLYTVTEDVKQGGTLKLFPSLRGQVQNGEQILYKNPKGKFILTTEKLDFDIKSISTMKIKATEVI